MHLRFRQLAILPFFVLLAAPMLQAQQWSVHDPRRPPPPEVDPGSPTRPPADAVVLFDGKDLSTLADEGRRARGVEGRGRLLRGGAGQRRSGEREQGSATASCTSSGPRRRRPRAKARTAATAACS